MSDVRVVDTQIVSMRQGQDAQRALPAIEEALEEMSQEIDRTVLAQIEQQGALDPDWAVQMWFEKYAIRCIRKKLTKRIRVGMRSAEKLGEDFAEGE